MTIIGCTGRCTGAVLDLYRRMFDSHAFAEAAQNCRQHLLPIRVIRKLRMQSDDGTLSGERPRMHVMYAGNPQYPGQMHFDLSDTKTGRRAFEQDVS